MRRAGTSRRDEWLSRPGRRPGSARGSRVADDLVRAFPGPMNTHPRLGRGVLEWGSMFPYCGTGSGLEQLAIRSDGTLRRLAPSAAADTVADILARLGAGGRLFAHRPGSRRRELRRGACRSRTRDFSRCPRLFRSQLRDAVVEIAGLSSVLCTESLLDLGVSSPQLDNARRGFSFSEGRTAGHAHGSGRRSVGG